MDIRLTKALRGLRFAAYTIVVMSAIIVTLMKGFGMMDEMWQTYAYVMAACMLLTPHVADSYTWLVNKFSSDEE